MAGTVTATFPAEELSLRGGKLEQARDVLVIHFGNLFPAEPALGLFVHTGLFLPGFASGFTFS